RLDLRGRRRAGEDQDTVAEGRGFTWCEPEVQLLFPVAEGLLPQGVRGEQTIATCMPVCGEADVLGMVQDGHRDGLAGNDAGQHGPATARAPHRVALETLGARVAASHAGIVE